MLIYEKGQGEEVTRDRERERVRKREMLSRERKRKTSSIHEKLQLLRSVTKSQAVNKTSIVLDAANYVKDLKQRVERIRQENSIASQSSSDREDPLVRVEVLEKGFFINVFSRKSCHGLLVAIMEAFEGLGIDVLDARVSCTESFQLEAIGEENNGQVEIMDAQVVKESVLQAMKNCIEE